MSAETALIVAAAAIVALLVAVDIRRRRAEAAPDPAPAPVAAGADLPLDAVPVPLVLVDAHDRVAEANAAARALVPGLAPQADARALGPALAEVLEAARAASGSVVRDTGPVGEPQRTARITAAAGSTGVLIALVDVTEDVDFEEARRAFSAAVSHELRTPLARILGLAETMALPGSEGDRAELAEQIEQEVDGMRRLIDEMLLLAALDRGRLAVADGVADLAHVVRGVVEDAQGRRLGRGRAIRVDAPPSVLVPVAVRLCEVVAQNLLDNALLHGGAAAAVDVRLAGDGGMAVLVVADDGVGIPAQHLPYVLQRFYRGDPSRTGPGSGLGLALVKHIVEAHGGDVAVESDGTSGALVRVRLPLAS